MKKIIQTLLISVVMLMQMSIAFASTATKFLTVFANVPERAGAEILSSSGLTLNFDPLNFDSEFGIYTTEKYYVVELSNFDVVQISYVETSSPSGAIKELGQVAFITLVKAVYQKGSNPKETILSKHALHNLDKIVNYSLVSGGWLKVYLGLSTGDKDKEPQGVSPFTSLDKPGQYTGTMTITATAL